MLNSLLSKAFSVIAPYKTWALYLALVLLGAGLAWGGAHVYYGRDIAVMKLDWSKKLIDEQNAKLAAQKLLMDKQTAWQKDADEMGRKIHETEIARARALVAVRDSLDGLRSLESSALALRNRLSKIAGAPSECGIAARAASVCAGLLGECGKEYREVGNFAQDCVVRHDALTAFYRKLQNGGVRH